MARQAWRQEPMDEPSVDQGLSAALQEIAEQQTVELAENKPLGPTGGAQQQAEQIGRPAVALDFPRCFRPR